MKFIQTKKLILKLLGFSSFAFHFFSLNNIFCFVSVFEQLKCHPIYDSFVQLHVDSNENKDLEILLFLSMHMVTLACAWLLLHV